MNTENPAVDAGLWAPVVHGRTRRVDIWWRALPAGVSQDGPEAGVVLAAVAGGRFPDRGPAGPLPRFVLARLRSGTLIGAACQFRLISTEMHADENRALYGFVGWFCANPRVTVPPLAQVERQWVHWAAPEYHRWIGPVWDETTARVRHIDQTAAEPPRWQPVGVSAYAGPEIGPEQFSAYDGPSPGYVRVYSTAVRDRIWQEIAVYGRSAAIVTNWASPSEAVRAGITHACADDLPSDYARLLPVPVQDRPRPPATPPAADQARGARPDQESQHRPGSWEAPAGAPHSARADVGSPNPRPPRDAAAPSGQWYGAGPTDRERDRPGPVAGEGGSPGDRGQSWFERAQGFADRLLGGADPRPGQPADAREAPPARRPPVPPDGRTWSFNPGMRAFRVREGRYTYQALLGTAHIDCWDDPRGPRFRFRLTEGGWTCELVNPSTAPGQPGSPARPQPVAPTAAAPPYDPSSERPARPPQLPDDLNKSFNAMFDDWGGSEGSGPPPAKDDERDDKQHDERGD